MADDHGGGENVMHTVWILAALLGGLIVFWYVNGGPDRADLRGIFLAPPAPLDSGEAYGPQINVPAQSAPQQYDY